MKKKIDHEKQKTGDQKMWVVLEGIFVVIEKQNKFAETNSKKIHNQL